jgi:hypothetical protein
MHSVFSFCFCLTVFSFLLLRMCAALYGTHPSFFREPTRVCDNLCHLPTATLTKKIAKKKMIKPSISYRCRSFLFLLIALPFRVGFFPVFSFVCLLFSSSLLVHPCFLQVLPSSVFRCVRGKERKMVVSPSQFALFSFVSLWKDTWRVVAPPSLSSSLLLSHISCVFLFVVSSASATQRQRKRTTRVHV